MNDNLLNETITMRPKGSKMYLGLKCLCNILKKDNLVLVEIGTYRGEGTKIFLDSGKFSKIYCIDPWQSGYDETTNASYSNMIKVEKDFDESVGKDNRVIKFKGTYEQWLSAYPNEIVDVIYHDGCHTYESVKNDLQLAVKNSFNIQYAYAGHDYHKTSIGVINAVNEIIGKPDTIFIDNSWIKFK